MTRVDWIALAIAALAALSGLKRGLVATALSLAGLAVGAVIGARLAPHFLHGGSHLAVHAARRARAARSSARPSCSRSRRWPARPRAADFRSIPPLRALDSIGGLVAGAALRARDRLGRRRRAAAAAGPDEAAPGGAAVAGPPAAERRSRRRARSCARSTASIRSPRSPARRRPRCRPTPRVLVVARPSRRVRPSVVRITATACGLGVEGSGWVARPHIVVTAAHVVAGRIGDPRRAATRRRRSSSTASRTSPSSACPGCALRRCRSSTRTRAIRSRSSATRRTGRSTRVPGRIGSTADVLVNGSLREVTALSGLVRHGNSGGPAVNAARRGRGDRLRRAHRRAGRLRRAGRARARGARAARTGRSRPAPADDQLGRISSTPSGRRNGATT